jgi:uncharacterized phage protein gp47/JayE
MAITTTGYSLKRFEDIIAEVRSDLIIASGNPNLDLSDDTLLGLLNNIWCLKLSELYELAQAQWSSGDIDTADGLALDRLVARVRITRQQAIKAYGTLQFTSTLGSVINAGTQVKDLAGNVVQTLTQLTLNSNDVVGVLLNVTALNNTTYSVVLNGSTYSVISDSSATTTEIINAFISTLSSNPTYIVSNESGRLKITNTVPFSYSTSAGLSAQNVTKSVNSEALVANTEDYESGTLNYLVNTNPAITVTNEQNWITGRALETDDELRIRFKSSRSQGNATVEAIYAKILSTAGVLSASVEENWTHASNINGLPAKSFEATVKGGSDLAVATTVWQTKPAGIQPFGNTNVGIVDSQGQTQQIYFTRPVDQYIHVNVVYQLYDEEVFPSNGEQMIANAINVAGQSLGVNQDVIPQRLMSAVYNAVKGIGNLSITIGKTSAPNDTPILSSSIITIGRKEESIFDLSRITVIAG